jgi:hypothetical protein
MEPLFDEDQHLHLIPTLNTLAQHKMGLENIPKQHKKCNVPLQLQTTGKSPDLLSWVRFQEKKCQSFLPSKRTI